ncbi:MAG: phasin family protein [Betaproteobacteria bacterium]|nr:phasin family protein [Betaproteobacteria bacterium]
MASTKNKPAFTAATPDWMSRIKESSHDVLLAGIGALARARKDGPRPAKGGKSAKSTGADFETLVSEGRKLEPEVKDSLQRVWTDLKEKSRTSMPSSPMAS